MKFYSTNNKELRVSFETAFLSGVASDGGLFMPEIIPKFTEAELEKLSQLSFADMAYEVASKFIEGDIPEKELRDICRESYNFELPLVSVKSDIFLELFHGPTLAFKDFAARFMARVSEYFLLKSQERRTILVATSGDTGGAVGNGFLGLSQVQVFILYPKGGVSPIQEKQLTTMGDNVVALEIDGTFDDCQRLVKEAFADQEFSSKLNLMSANSINIGRIIPQTFYYIYTSLALKKLNPNKEIIFSVPSGNFGNVTGGVFAKLMGAPIERFIVANNANHPFCEYLETGEFVPVKSVHTFSNAMDIGHPNNYYRLSHLFKNDMDLLRSFLWGSHFSDTETAKMISEYFKTNNYLMCPHTAVAHLGVQKYRTKVSDSELMVTVSTAHPAKFKEVVESITETDIVLPEKLSAAFKQKKQAYLVSPDLDSVEATLLQYSSF